MGLYIKQVDNTLTPEELKIKRDKEIKDLFTSIGVHKLDKKSWKARKEVKSPNIYIANTRDDGWSIAGVTKMLELKKAIKEAGLTTSSVANKATMETVPFRPFYNSGTNHTIFSNIVEETAKTLMGDMLANDLDTTVHPTIVPINLYSLKDNEHYVVKSIEANYLFKDKISDTLLTDEAWIILVKTCDAFAKHGIDVNSTSAIAVCATEVPLPTTDEEAKECRNWTASGMYWLAKTYGTVVFNILDENDFKTLLGILTQVKEDTLDITKIADYMAQRQIASPTPTQQTTNVAVAEDEIPF